MDSESAIASSVIESMESLLTTVPCTTITEPSKYPPVKPRFRHDIVGWSPDVEGVQRFARGDYARQDAPAKYAECRQQSSSVYLMNYMKPSPKHCPRNLEKVEPPSGFAVPVRAVASVSESASTKIFSSPLPVYHLRANPLHRSTFYKCVFQTVEKLDCEDKHFATWATANVSPRFSVLHLSCNAGAVTAVNLVTGQCVQKSLSSTSVSEVSNQHQTSPNIADESIRMMKLRANWPSEPRIVARAPSTQASDHGEKYDEAWDEVHRELSNLQQMFGNEYEQSFPVYKPEDNTEYERQVLKDYATVLTTPTTTHQSYDTTIGEEESEMQLMTPSEPSEFEKNLRFRRSFETVFKGRYEPNGPIDRWLQMMTDQNVTAPGRYRQVAGRDHSYKIDDVINEEEEEVDDEEEDQLLQVLSTCENVLKQLENVTATSRPSNTDICQNSVCDCRESTIRAASSTSGIEESFALIRKG